MHIDPSNLTLNNYVQDVLVRLKELEKRALSIIRLSLEDSLLLQTKEIKNPFTLWNKLKALY